MKPTPLPCACAANLNARLHARPEAGPLPHPPRKRAHFVAGPTTGAPGVRAHFGIPPGARLNRGRRRFVRTARGGERRRKGGSAPARGARQGERAPAGPGRPQPHGPRGRTTRPPRPRRERGPRDPHGDRKESGHGRSSRPGTVPSRRHAPKAWRRSTAPHTPQPLGLRTPGAPLPPPGRLRPNAEPTASSP